MTNESRLMYMLQNEGSLFVSWMKRLGANINTKPLAPTTNRRYQIYLLTLNEAPRNNDANLGTVIWS